MMRSKVPVISAEILLLVSAIDEFKGAWRAREADGPDRLNVLRRAAAIESIGSSARLAGGSLTDHEAETLLLGLTGAARSARCNPIAPEEYAVIGCAKALDWVYGNWAQITLNEDQIKQLHQTVLLCDDTDATHRGQYKTTSNSVVAKDANGRVIELAYETTSPADTPSQVQEMLRWFAQERVSKSMHPLLAIAVFIGTFFSIQPFEDGNGRLARLLTSLLLLQAGYAHVPFSSLESVVEQNVQSGYQALRETQSTLRTTMDPDFDTDMNAPDWQPWVTFFLRAVHAQVLFLEDALANVQSEQADLSLLPELSAKILELARANGRITLQVAVARTCANRSTTKQHLQKLVDVGHLNRHGAGRGVWYGLV